MVAVLGTEAIVFALLAVRLRRPFGGFVAVAVTLTTPVFVDYHAARSGDYDALLALLTTAYLVAAWLFFEDSPVRRTRWLALAAAAIALAFLAKSVQGLVFVPALFLYAAWRGKLRELLGYRPLYAVAVGVVAVIVGWFVVREVAGPGYISGPR